jgi:hypothetical protein
MRSAVVEARGDAVPALARNHQLRRLRRIGGAPTAARVVVASSSIATLTVLRAANAAHPERFARGVPVPPALPIAAWINKPPVMPAPVAPEGASS